MAGGSYVICIANDGLEASLERFKVYRRLSASPDDLPLVRIVDESGEDYLFDAGRFVEIDLPQVASLIALEP